MEDGVLITLKLEVLSNELNNQVFEPRSIVFVDQTIIEYSEGLVDPQFHKRILSLNTHWLGHADSLHNFGHISEIEQVMELGGSWSQIFLDLSVDFDGGLDGCFLKVFDFVSETSS